LTQTTLSLDETKDIIAALRAKFPNIKGPAAQDICYATENRQVAVKQVASESDLLLVVGSENSSNSNRLVEVARNLGTNSHLIDSFKISEPEWLERCEDDCPDRRRFGAGMPGGRSDEVSCDEGFGNVQEVEVMPENVRFGLPPGDCGSDRRRSGNGQCGLKSMTNMDINSPDANLASSAVSLPTATSLRQDR
jgi:4-hydroxy-3-methylbut-2-en-1-yl diphosphate reductase